MSLFKRLFGNEGSESSVPQNSNKQSRKESETFFLDEDSSSSLGNRDFMRRSNEIRRTFPGNKDNPGNKEFIVEVDSLTSSLKTASAGLGDAVTKQRNVRLNDGIPNAPKKTFAQRIDDLQLTQKRSGAVSAVNAPLTTPPVARKTELKPEGSTNTSKNNSSSLSAKPGSTDPFKNMARDLNK